MYKNYVEEQEEAATRDHQGLTPPHLLAKQSKKDKLRTQAHQQFVDGVSIAGLLEFYYAFNLPQRLLWGLTLGLALGSIVYHSIVLVNAYKNQQANYDFLQTDAKEIPFPKVTVCAPTGNNRSWIAENLFLPEREKRLYDKMDPASKEEFVDAIAALVGRGQYYMLEKGLTPSSRDYKTFHNIIRLMHQNLSGGIERIFFNGAFPSCERTVSRCQIDGLQFDCCENATVQVDHYGPCYDLRVEDYSINRTRPVMSPTSFTFDLAMDWDYISAYSTVNGFFIHLGDPHSVLGRPIAVPAGTHTVIEMSQPTWKIDQLKCHSSAMPATRFGPYDARGYNCVGDKYMDMVYSTMGCQYSFGQFVPNDTSACTGDQLLPMNMFYAYGVGDKRDNATKKYEMAYREQMIDLFKACLPHCEMWDFQPRASFSQLILPDLSTPDAMNLSEHVSRSRVTVTMSSSFYIEQRQAVNGPYATFLHIADVSDLYLGCSIVTVAEVVFYGFAVLCVYWKTRTRRKVGPAIQQACDMRQSSQYLR